MKSWSRLTVLSSGVLPMPTTVVPTRLSEPSRAMAKRPIEPLPAFVEHGFFQSG
jgi:hypothetical protein